MTEKPVSWIVEHVQRERNHVPYTPAIYNKVEQPKHRFTNEEMNKIIDNFEIDNMESDLNDVDSMKGHFEGWSKEIFSTLTKLVAMLKANPKSLNRQRLTKSAQKRQERYDHAIKVQKSIRPTYPDDVTKLKEMLVVRDEKLKNISNELKCLKEANRRQERALINSDSNETEKIISQLNNELIIQKKAAKATKEHNSLLTKQIKGLHDELFRLHHENERVQSLLVSNSGTKDASNVITLQAKIEELNKKIEEKDQKISECEKHIKILIKQRDNFEEQIKRDDAKWNQRFEAWQKKEIKLTNKISEFDKYNLTRHSSRAQSGDTDIVEAKKTNGHPPTIKEEDAKVHLPKEQKFNDNRKKFPWEEKGRR
ncbi:hypothetical protein O9G_002503 [Rozella allomycis CSF55]|uniref:Lebercilin domain-containing protein n=1 Tax=Rozella allomycis (strain CSF55) TaxID=988480 RepID=A0A075AU13_ROZAC|nr:hypothetical protein O9G_002503 [Rozella allomycis CSF55]|eukprot:EPZ33791.1 hypothetical protein O9G_002503 [Rozella allomycis CSF55]